MAELADAPDSKSGSFGSEGSTPSLGTIQVLDKKHFKETEKIFLSSRLSFSIYFIQHLKFLVYP